MYFSENHSQALSFGVILKYGCFLSFYSVVVILHVQTCSVVTLKNNKLILCPSVATEKKRRRCALLT